MMVKSKVPYVLVGVLGMIDNQVLPEASLPTPALTGAQLPRFLPASPHTQASEVEAPCGLM